MPNTFVGIFFLILAGIMNGSFILPMKFMRRWAWENTWLFWTIFALVIFPVLIPLATLVSPGLIYHRTPTAVILTVILCGAGWGVSQVFFGLAIDAVGMGLGFSVILGISAAVGSLVPLVRFHPEQILSRQGLTVIAGVALVLLGVAFCAVAGRRREAALGQFVSTRGTSMMMGLFFCLLSGLGSALVNFGLTFGAPLIAAAQDLGTRARWAPNAVWMPLMCAGALPSILYCVYLLRKNRTANRFAQSVSPLYLLLAALMAFCWFGSTLLYGIASGLLGSLGAVLGWPLFMSIIVIAASLWGVATGEWKGAGRRAIQPMTGGVIILLLAVFVLSLATR
jgi:L-rhamnose-H+ transport protein